MKEDYSYMNIRKALILLLSMQTSTLCAVERLPSFFDKVTFSSGQAYSSFNQKFDSGNTHDFKDFSPYTSLDLEKSFFNKKLNIGFEGTALWPIETTVYRNLNQANQSESKSKTHNVAVQCYFTGPYWTKYNIALGLGLQYYQFEFSFNGYEKNETFGTVPMAIIKVGNNKISPHGLTLKAGLNTRSEANNNDKFSPYLETAYSYSLHSHKNIETAIEFTYSFSRTNWIFMSNIQNDKHALSLGTQFTFR
jgi:hypothetical protein